MYLRLATVSGPAGMYTWMFVGGGGDILSRLCHSLIVLFLFSVWWIDGQLIKYMFVCFIVLLNSY